jgi:hypothetical protein
MVKKRRGDRRVKLTRGQTVTLIGAALIVVAIVAGSLAFYFAEQTSSLNAQVSSLDVQISSLHGHVLALENQTTALKQTDLVMCQGINRTVSSIHQSLMNFTGTLELQIRTDQLLVTALNAEMPANYSAAILSLDRQIGQDGNMLIQTSLLAAETQLNIFYGPSNFCSLASRP